ncbi:MAG TPA: hypothetical protein VHC20_07640 [Candidatus Paceibacterota bacterium]|nr:hypothetical protein [Candidatus Paceibacterota bacterium]
MKKVLYEKALAESEGSLPDALRSMPEGVRKGHVKEIVDNAWRKVLHFHGQGVTDIALLAKSFTIAYISQATAEEMVRDIITAA